MTISTEMRNGINQALATWRRSKAIFLLMLIGCVAGCVGVYHLLHVCVFLMVRVMNADIAYAASRLSRMEVAGIAISIGGMSWAAVAMLFFCGNKRQEP